MTLRGRVTPVGGIKEKVRTRISASCIRYLKFILQVLGAHRAKVSKVILPWANRKDVEHDVAAEIRNEMQFVFVRTVGEVLEAAFGKDTLVWRTSSLLIESRL
jgi:ATP-dependent Lon protease